LRKRGNPVASTSTAGRGGRGNGKRRKVEGGCVDGTPGPSETSAGDVEGEHEVTPDNPGNLHPNGSERGASSTPSSVGAEVKPVTATPPTIDPWYESFSPSKDWVPQGTSQSDYTEEGCRSLERKFWRELGLGEACWYGADMKGSLFTEETTSWNVAHLPNLLNRLNLKRKLPGVNTPYLYWGMWAAAFAWHVEDVGVV
jgi:hypothetical protein